MTHFQPHRLKKKKFQCRAVGSRLNAGPPSQGRAVISTQGRQRNAGPSTQRRAAVSSMGWPSTQRRAVVSIQGRRLNRRPFSQCRACQFHAGALAQCSAVSCRCRLFQCRHVCFNAGPVCFDAGLSPQCRAVCLLNTEIAQSKASPQCSVVPSAPCRARLLNAGPVCSTQRRSAQRKAVRSMQSGREAVSSRQGISSMQGCSFQCRATSSTQGRHLNAGAFGRLDHDLLTEFSSEKKPTPWCLFFLKKKPVLGVHCFFWTSH